MNTETRCIQTKTRRRLPVGGALTPAIATPAGANSIAGHRWQLT